MTDALTAAEKLVFDKQEQDFCGPLDHMVIDLLMNMAEKADQDQHVWSIGGTVVDLTSADSLQYTQQAFDDLYAQFVNVVRDWAVKNRIELKPKPTAS